MSLLLAALLVLGLATASYGKLITKTISYKQDDTVLKGYLAYDDAVKGKRPGVLVVHEFWGLNDFAKKAAERVAKPGLRGPGGGHVRAGEGGDKPR